MWSGTCRGHHRTAQRRFRRDEGGGGSRGGDFARSRGGIRAGRALPGNHGILFRQFALTIAFSVSISAFNALTLTPALSAVFLGKHRERAKGRFFNGSMTDQRRRKVLSKHRPPGSGLAAGVVAVLFCLAWLHLLALSARSARLHPGGRSRLLDIIVQAPQGASLTYTRDICGKAEEVISRDPEIEGVFTIVGFGASGSSSNQAILTPVCGHLKNRKGDVHSAAAAIARLRGSLSAVSGAIVVPFNPPAVQGLGQFGGFQFELEDLGRQLRRARCISQRRVRPRSSSSNWNPPNCPSPCTAGGLNGTTIAPETAEREPRKRAIAAAAECTSPLRFSNGRRLA